MNMFLAEILFKKPGMKRFCKVNVTDAHKLEAVYLAKFKWEKSEEARKEKEAKEAEEAKKLEDEQNNG